MGGRKLDDVAEALYVRVTSSNLHLRLTYWISPTLRLTHGVAAVAVYTCNRRRVHASHNLCGSDHPFVTCAIFDRPRIGMCANFVLVESSSVVYVATVR